MRLRRARPLASSVAAHAAIAALLAALTRWRRPHADPPVFVAPAVELTFEAPPATVTPAPAAPTALPPTAPAPGPAVRARAALAPPPPRAASAGSAPAPEPAPTATPAPTPTATPAPAPAPRINAMELLRSTRHDAEALVNSGAIALDVSAPPPRSRDLVNLPTGSPLDRARVASSGYVRDRLAEAPERPEAPGVRTYYWHLRRRMEETWRPGLSREPSIGQTLLSSLAMPFEQQVRATELAMGAGARPGRVGSSHDALNAAQGSTNSDAMHADPMQGNGVRPMIGIVDRAQLNTTLTRAEIQVDQSEDGNVITIRVVRSSRIPSYDAAALSAVRDALPLQTPAHMPGGRRSRWSFQTVASRAPFVPGVGMAFDESSGWFEVVYPGRVTLRSRVWLESARPLGT